MLGMDAPTSPTGGAPKSAKPQESAAPAKAEPAEVKKAVEPAAAPKNDAAPMDADLEDMTVGDLRRKARGVEGFPLTKTEIKFAKKDELLEAFSKVN
jgi:hypothetical protein